MSGEKRAPELPEVVDEAGDSAPWVPRVGLLLFGLLAIVAVLKLFGTDPQPPAKPAAEPTTAANP